MEQKQKPLPSGTVEKDTIWFMVILSVVVIGMYVVTLFSNPAILKPVRLIPFTGLMAVHLFLHWRLGSLVKNSFSIPRYIVFQGAIVFTIILISESTILPIALFMGLIGEVVGLLGLTRWGALAISYYLILGTINLGLLMDFQSMWGWLIGMVPMLFFVVIYVVLYQRQMDAREKALDLLQQLEAANQQLSEYAVRVEDLTISAERQRMARELHDTLSQGLAGLILQLEAVDAHLTHNRIEKAVEIVGQSMERARLTLKEARYMIGDLRGENRVDQTLISILQEQVTRFEKNTGIECQFDYFVQDQLPEYVNETILRITSEALTNISRHAKANRVIINFSKKEDGVNLTIQDDGIGFNPTELTAGHYGLIGMRERAKLAKGTFFLVSQPNLGTKIEIFIPTEVIHDNN